MKGFLFFLLLCVHQRKRERGSGGVHGTGGIASLAILAQALYMVVLGHPGSFLTHALVPEQTPNCFNGCVKRNLTSLFIAYNEQFVTLIDNEKCRNIVMTIFSIQYFR